MTLACDGVSSCKEPVSFVDPKGYAYCAKHGEALKASGRRMRKLRSAEIKKLEQKETIRY